MGGPVGAEGDIEEVGDRVSIICPTHRHRIDLSTGSCLVNGMEGLTVTEQRQRVHGVHLDSGYVWVNIQVAGGYASLASDKYNVVARGQGLASTSAPNDAPYASQQQTYSSQQPYASQQPIGGYPSPARPYYSQQETHPSVYGPGPISFSQPAPVSSPGGGGGGGGALPLSQGAEPLMPYAGYTRFAPVPSPVKLAAGVPPSPQQQHVPAARGLGGDLAMAAAGPSHAAPEAPVPFHQHRRIKFATEAVLKKMGQMPHGPLPVAPEPAGPSASAAAAAAAHHKRTARDADLLSPSKMQGANHPKELRQGTLLGMGFSRSLAQQLEGAGAEQQPQGPTA
jgi:hypothetical protein